MKTCAAASINCAYEITRKERDARQETAVKKIKNYLGQYSHIPLL